MDFYDELDAGSASPWRRVGWRRRIEQAYRFEFALEAIRASEGRVADVGCGLGDLSRYASACGLECEFVGVERRGNFASEVPHEVIVADFEQIELNAGCAVALGILGTGTELPSLVRFLQQSADVFAATALSTAGLRQRPVSSVEHGAASVDPGVKVKGANLATISVTDVGIFWGFVPATIRERFHRTVAGPWGQIAPTEEHAWLACELELWDEATLHLERSAPSPLTALLHERLALR